MNICVQVTGSDKDIDLKKKSCTKHRCSGPIECRYGWEKLCFEDYDIRSGKFQIKTLAKSLLAVLFIEYVDADDTNSSNIMHIST